MEQPHRPFAGVVADFSQLPPVTSGGVCQTFCESMTNFVELKTIFRSEDPAHLLFLNRIRANQPRKKILKEYFEDRHWQDLTLEECVAIGMEMAEETNDGFTWLTATNAGAGEVCEAALHNLGITAEDIRSGFLCDTTTKSTLRILAVEGIIIRLSRNLDKGRGFVNGALARIEYPLRGNAVFVATLLGSGNRILVYPMYENGAVFLPCSYGYATTVRRAQGASLSMGCIYFNQRHRAAPRGYGYVAASRFRTREGCFLYGKLRRTDFLPVDGEDEDEILERGIESQSEDEEDAGIKYAGMSGDLWGDLSGDAVSLTMDADFDIEDLKVDDP
jgi:hypothetical protein